MIDQPATVRVALLTPAGRGALAVVGVAGADACTLADRQFSGRRGVSLKALDDRSVGVGRWRGGGPTDADQPGEELVVVRHAADWLEAFAAAVRSIDEVMEVYRLSGEIDYLLKIVVPDIAAYDDVYKRLIARADFADVSSFFAMEEIKATTALPLRYAE